VLNWFNMIRVFIFILFSFHFLEAQDKGKMFLPKPKYESLFKTVPPISDKDPHWVHLLYSESPNYFEIHREYDNAASGSGNHHNRMRVKLVATGENF